MDKEIKKEILNFETKVNILFNKTELRKALLNRKIKKNKFIISNAKLEIVQLNTNNL